MLEAIFVVGLGSFVGGISRYLLAPYVQGLSPAGSSFPWGTFVVNILGCFAIGVFYGVFERWNLMNPNLKLFLTAGLCGGFTTFSTFMNESFQLVRAQDYFYAALYLSSSLFFGLLALYLAQLLIKLI